MEVVSKEGQIGGAELGLIDGGGYGFVAVGGAYRALGEESVIESPERLVTWIWSRASMLRLRTVLYVMQHE